MSRESAIAMTSATPVASKTELVTPPATPTVPETPKPDELQSQRLAIFAKKESALQKERETLKKEREDWLKEKVIADQYKAKGLEFDELRKKDPIAAAKLIGFTETEIFNFLNGEKTEPNPEDIARRVAQEEAQKVRDELKTQAEDAQKKRNDELISNLRTEIGQTITKEAEKYEYCAFEGAAAERLAYEFINENLLQNNELLSVPDAIALAEEYYESRDKAMASLKKRQPKTDSAAEVEIPPKEVAKEVPRGTNQGKAPVSNAKPKTLTNDVGPSAAGIANPITRKETPAEKRQRLIDKLGAIGRQ